MMDEKRSGLVPFDLHIHDLDFMVYAFGMPKVSRQFRSKRPEQDFISVSYDFDGFSINTEASWYATCYPFTAQFRFQFEKAIVANENGKMKIYLNFLMKCRPNRADFFLYFSVNIWYNSDMQISTLILQKFRPLFAAERSC
jgi:predicted dehydrogenase